MKHAFKNGLLLFFTVVILLSSACYANRKTYNTTPTKEPRIGPGAWGNITFTYGEASEEEKLSVEAYVSAFNKEYPDIHVDIDYTTGDLSARIKSGDIGDVFHFPDESVYDLAVTKSALTPLDIYLEPLNIDCNKIYPSIYDLGMANGILYMAAKEYNRTALIVNVDALKASGLSLPKNDWTWEEFLLNYGQELLLKNNDGTFKQVPMNINLASDSIYIPFMEGWGGSWYDSVNKKINLTDKNVVMGIDEFIRTADAGILFRSCKEDLSEYSNLQEYNYVFNEVTYRTLNELGNEYDNLGIEWDVVSMPNFPTPKNGTSSSGFGVYNKTPFPDAAACFALFIFTEEGQKAFHGEQGGSVPILKSLANEDFWKNKKTEWKDKNYDAFIGIPDSDTAGRLQCRIPAEITKILEESWRDMLEMHFAGFKNYRDTLETIEKDVNEQWANLNK